MILFGILLHRWSVHYLITVNTVSQQEPEMQNVVTMPFHLNTNIILHSCVSSEVYYFECFYYGLPMSNARNRNSEVHNIKESQL